MTEYSETSPPQAQDSQKRTGQSCAIEAGTAGALTSVQTLATSVRNLTGQRLTTSERDQPDAISGFCDNLRRLDMRPAQLEAEEELIARALETLPERIARGRKEASGKKQKAKSGYKRDWKNARKSNREIDRIRGGNEPPPKISTLDHLQKRASERTRWSKKRRKLAHLRTVQAKALKPYNPRLASRMFLCERIGREYTCIACGSQGTVPIGCNVRGCPACESKKADRDAAKYGPMFKDLPKGVRKRFITLTFKNVPIVGLAASRPDGLLQTRRQAQSPENTRRAREDAQALRAALCTLGSAFRKLRTGRIIGLRQADPETGKRPFKKDMPSLVAFHKALRGGLWKREVTVKWGRVIRDGVDTGEVGAWWHVHLHVVYWGDYIDQKYLKLAWYALTGCSIVDIRERSNIREIVKYSCKAFDYEGNKRERADGSGKGMGFAEVEERSGGRVPAGYLVNLWHVASRRLRLIQTFGEGYAVADPEDGDPQCPDCGGYHFQVRKCVIAYDPRGPPLDVLWRGADLYNPPPKIEPGN